MRRTVHVIATVGLAGLAVPLGFAWPDAWLGAGGVAAGIVFSPDLDQSDTPYGWVHKHRGLSHWPVVGTADRTLWFLGPALAAWLATGRELDWEGLALLFAGLCLSDGLHELVDWLEKKTKKRRKQ